MPGDVIEGRELRSVQTNGEVTLPKEWREEYELDGGYVFVQEGENGEVVITPVEE